MTLRPFLFTSFLVVLLAALGFACGAEPPKIAEGAGDASSPPIRDGGTVDAPSLDAPTVPLPIADAAAHDASADADGDSSPLNGAAEIGFIDVPPQVGASKVLARMFYVFQQAEDRPNEKPLVVFFNGGPGAATTKGLLAFGTGAATLDEAADGPPHANAARWTRFANVLYVDERDAGFSYGLGPVDPACSFSMAADAGDFVRVILRFLAAHAAIQKNPVILAGESYGGTRAMFAMAMFLRYPTEAAFDPTLVQEIQKHYDATLGAAGNAVDSARAAAQFGRAVLIQPLLIGRLQYDEQYRMIATDPVFAPTDAASQDAYDVQKPAGWLDALEGRALATFSDAARGQMLLGAPLDSATQILPAARTGAERPVELNTASVTALNNALKSRFGPLGSKDYYYGIEAPACSPSNVYNDPVGSGQQLLANLRDASLFLTNARYDSVIRSGAIPTVIANQAKLPVTIDTAPRSGVARPGWIRVDLPASALAPAKTAIIRYPAYANSGHCVSATEPAEFADDVADWIASP